MIAARNIVQIFLSHYSIENLEVNFYVSARERY